VRSLFSQVTKVEPAGAILSSATDMAKWMQMHLNKGVSTSGERLLLPSDMKDMYDVSIGGIRVFPPDMTRPTFPVADVCLGYGLGWISSIYRGSKQTGADYSLSNKLLNYINLGMK